MCGAPSCLRIFQDAYAADCMTLCGRVLDGALFSELPEDATPSAPWERKAEAECTRVWEQRFPHEAYSGEEWDDWEEAQGDDSKGTSGMGEGEGQCNGGMEGAGEMACTSIISEGGADAGVKAGGAGAERGAQGVPQRSPRVLQELQNRSTPRTNELDIFTEAAPQKGKDRGPSAPQEHTVQGQVVQEQGGEGQGELGQVGQGEGGKGQIGQGKGEKGRLQAKPSQLTYDLVDAVQRQSTFFFQVCPKREGRGRERRRKTSGKGEGLACRRTRDE